MSKIVDLSIKNFRGISELSLSFDPKQDLVCFVGRGDSCKTTILDAISFTLSPQWNINFFDTDFHGGKPDEPIEISATLIDMPTHLIADKRYGLYVRGYSHESHEITDEFDLDAEDNSRVAALTIKLIVASSLEPQWIVTNSRIPGEKLIGSTDRASIHCTLISDYVDRHFSWSRGGPLNSLLHASAEKNDAETSTNLTDLLREAKALIDKSDFDELGPTTQIVKNAAREFGLNLANLKTTLDARELSIKDGKLSLHESTTPLRLKGKGSRRLASMAIQSAIVSAGGIMLVDEIEQGLEPDRIRHVIRSLKGLGNGQIFISTHSRDAIVELGSKALTILLRDESRNRFSIRSYQNSDEHLQGTVRACPEAFFSRKVIVCEGATEIGICRSLDSYRTKTLRMPSMAFCDCSYVDGVGTTLAGRVYDIYEAGISVSLFCDSDLRSINEQKEEWRKKNISIFDCEEGLCLEQQIFKDLHWKGVQTLLKYASENNTESFTSIFDKEHHFTIDDWEETSILRQKIVDVFRSNANGETKRSWFKKIHHGEFLGEVLFEYFSKYPQNTHLNNTLNSMLAWVD